MPEKKDFQQMRREATEAVLRLERARADLKRREEIVRSVLTRLRETCPHPQAVEIRYEWVEALGDCAKRRASGRRYCLSCGTDESASTYSLGLERHHYQYRWLEKSEVVRQEVCHESAAYTGLLAIFIEHLHEKARFDEFDDTGVWSGEKKPDQHIRRGED